MGSLHCKITCSIHSSSHFPAAICPDPCPHFHQFAISYEWVCQWIESLFPESDPKPDDMLLILTPSPTTPSAYLYSSFCRVLKIGGGLVIHQHVLCCLCDSPQQCVAVIFSIAYLTFVGYLVGSIKLKSWFYIGYSLFYVNIRCVLKS